MSHVAIGYARPLGLLFLRHSVSDSLIKIQCNLEHVSTILFLFLFFSPDAAILDFSLVSRPKKRTSLSFVFSRLSLRDFPNPPFNSTKSFFNSLWE